jgi:hypothetical protein
MKKVDGHSKQKTNPKTKLCSHETYPTDFLPGHIGNAWAKGTGHTSNNDNKNALTGNKP